MNLLVSGAIVLFSDKTKGDPTLAEAMRRITDAAIEWSLGTGIFLEALISALLIFWEGAGAFNIYARPRLSRSARIPAFIIASGIQMFIWTKIYVFGYGVIEAIAHIL